MKKEKERSGRKMGNIGYIESIVPNDQSGNAKLDTKALACYYLGKELHNMYP